MSFSPNLHWSCRSHHGSVYSTGSSIVCVEYARIGRNQAFMSMSRRRYFSVSKLSRETAVRRAFELAIGWAKQRGAL